MMHAIGMPMHFQDSPKINQPTVCLSQKLVAKNTNTNVCISTSYLHPLLCQLTVKYVQDPRQLYLHVVVTQNVHTVGFQ